MHVLEKKHETNHEINAVSISGNAKAMRAHDSGNSTHLFFIIKPSKYIAVKMCLQMK